MNAKYYVAVNAEQIVEDIIDFIKGHLIDIDLPNFSMTFTFRQDGTFLEIGIPYDYVSGLVLGDGDSFLVEKMFMEFAHELKTRHNLADVEVTA